MIKIMLKDKELNFACIAIPDLITNGVKYILPTKIIIYTTAANATIVAASLHDV